MRGVVIPAGVALLLSVVSTASAAQDPAAVQVAGAEGEAVSLGPRAHHGYTAVPARGLDALGWEVDGPDDGVWRLRHRGGAVVEVVPGDPFFRWDGAVRQLVDPPYLHDGALWVPAQLVLDFLPFELPRHYRMVWDGEAPHLEMLNALSPEPDSGAGSEDASARPADSETLVVIIDPGHGGLDRGAVGPGGSREKDVALALGRALARELGRYPGVEVRLTREADELVPLWRRGEWATEVKGDRSGIFVSLHANAMAERSTRGFETYFLSEARTEHERRVAAMENAPLELAGGNGSGDGSADGDLGFILNELRNLDHQHWSALLADLVQQRLRGVHPGPDRGVKQGPFAVITNALMPAVLVEVGFMSNPEEERLLGRQTFHDDVAEALARAVVDFFRRYPPGRSRVLEPVGSPNPAP